MLRSEGNKVIPLSAGEPNFNTPAPIKEAVKKPSMRTTAITSPTGACRTAADPVGAERLGDRRHLRSGDGGIHHFQRRRGHQQRHSGLCGRGRRGHYLHPGLCQLQESGKILWRRVCGSAPKKEDGFQIDPAALEAAVTEKTKMIILNNPNNPTARGVYQGKSGGGGEDRRGAQPAGGVRRDVQQSSPTRMPGSRPSVNSRG